MKCKEYVESNRQYHVKYLWSNIMYSNRESEFVEHLKHFEVVCANIPLFVQYVHKTWLTSYKERFVVVWTNRVTHLENVTKNRYIDMTLNTLQY